MKCNYIRIYAHISRYKYWCHNSLRLWYILVYRIIQDFYLSTEALDASFRAGGRASPRDPSLWFTLASTALQTSLKGTLKGGGLWKWGLWEAWGVLRESSCMGPSYLGHPLGFPDSLGAEF